MVARWADGEEVAAALFEDAFGGAEYFLLVRLMCMGLVIGWVVGGQSQKECRNSMKIIFYFVDPFLDLPSSSIARPCSSNNL